MVCWKFWKKVSLKNLDKIQNNGRWLHIKQCKDCGELKELSEFYCYEKVNAKGEHYTWCTTACKQCVYQRSLKSRNKNHEGYLEYMKELNSKEENKLKRRESGRKRRKEGKLREWQQQNKDRVREYGVNRRHKNHKITLDEWDACRLYFDYRCAYCDMTYEEHFEKYGQDLHKEHVDHEGTNDLSNCVPSCLSCNSSKNIYSITEWYNEQNETFDIKRINKINQWISSDFTKYIKSI